MRLVLNGSVRIRDNKTFTEITVSDRNFLFRKAMQLELTEKGLGLSSIGEELKR